MALDLSCPDWWEKLQAGQTPIADLDLDDEQAEQAVAIFDRLKLPDVPGKPAMAEAAGEWMRDIVRAAFGSLETSSKVKRRQVGEIFVLVPKKNAKTTSAAAIALTFMLMNTRHHADMLIIGPTQKISEVAFEQARGMIEADEYLVKRFHVQAHKKTIEDRVTKTRLMVRTFGMDVLTGAKPIFCLIDEIHILGSVPYAPDVMRQIRGGMIPFPESLLVMITTQSDHPPAGLFRSELQYARAVRDGRVTEGVRLLPVLYEFPEAIQTSEDQLWRDPDYWHLVTPNLGHSITLERLVEAYKRAEADGKEEVIGWATQHLNVEVGMALHADRWIGADHWPAAADKAVSLQAIIDECEVATIGIDGGGLDDLAGLAIIGRHRDTKVWMHWAHAWAHPEVLERRKEISGRLLRFEELGELTVCKEPTQDLVEMADLCEMLLQAGLLPETWAVGLDPYDVAALVDELAGRGFTDDMMVAVRQGAALSPIVWGLPRKLKDGTFLHGGQELMTWVIENAIAEQRGNAVIITKQVAGKAKIDPLIATFNAGMLMNRNPQAQGLTVYADRGALVI